VSRAFDGDLVTAYRAAGTPEDGSFVAHTFPEPRQVGSVTVIGTGAGTIEVLADGEWQQVGALSEDVAFHEAAVDAAGPVDGVRLVVAAGSAAPVIHEVVAREGGPVGSEVPTEEPTTEQPTTDEPTQGPTSEDPTGVPTDDGGAPGELPSTGAGGTGALLAGGLAVLLGTLLAV